MKLPDLAHLVLTTALAFAPSRSFAALYDIPIKTEYGTVQGFKYFNSSTTQKYFNLPDSDVAAFLGIPYAADTAYENRWKEAQPRKPWNGTLKATGFGPACPIAQARTRGFEISEDCLSVNIWTPATSANASLPVMVWNYGSGETSGETIYDGGGLATKDVVVVTYNYRDAAFGFLAHEDLNAESGRNSSGNYGILDFVTALQWVQKNIASFGGDPTKVTIAGQSFGSAQVYHAVNSPPAKGLFRAMIAESGIRDPYDPLLAGLADSYRTLEVNLRNGANYTSFHNASSIAELRTLSMDQLLVGSDDRDYSVNSLTALWTSYPPLYKPTLDGYVLPSTYLASLRNGPASDVAMMTGNTRDESGAETTKTYTLAQYQTNLTQWYGNLTSAYTHLYPATNDSSADESWKRAATDLSLVSSYRYANAWYQTAQSPIYTYYWDHALPGAAASQGASHMSEIYYVLNGLHANTAHADWTAYDIWVADVMSSYWANFVKTLDPNEGGSLTNGSLAPWARNEVGNQTVMRLGDGFGAVPVATPEKVAFLETWLDAHVPY